MLNRALGMFRRDPQLSVVLFVGVVIAYLSLSPTLMLFYGSFRSKPLGVPSGEFTLVHYINAYTDPLTYQLLFNSFYFAAGSALLATVLGGDLGVDFDSHQRAFPKIFRADRDRAKHFSAGHAGRVLDGVAEPAHRVDQSLADGNVRSVPRRRSIFIHSRA